MPKTYETNKNLRPRCERLTALLYNLSMSTANTLVVRYYRTRSSIWRWQRILFPSHAEVRFIQLMGGRLWQVKHLKPFRNRQPLTIVLSLGRRLREERFKREVRIGKYYVDFANDIGRVIEIDGAAYHTDVLADMDREIYIRQRLPDFRLHRIKAYHIYNNTRKVQWETLQFIQDGKVRQTTA